MLLVKDLHGGSYNADTGIVTFTSDDSIGFTTEDLRGSNGSGFTGGSYNADTGVVTFTSDDGLAFTTGDLRGSDATGPTYTAGAGLTETSNKFSITTPETSTFISGKDNPVQLNGTGDDSKITFFTAGRTFTVSGTSSSHDDETSLFLGTNPSSIEGKAGYNTVFGIDSLSSLTAGYWNTMIGSEVGSKITVGKYNVGIGPNTLDAGISLEFNIAIGASALKKLDDSSTAEGLDLNIIILH